MSDSEDDNLFGDSDDDGNESDDTADLIAASQQQASKKKAAPAARKKTAAAAAAADDSSSSDDGGLFDSDSDDDDDDDKKPAAAAASKKKVLSKREKLEALARRKKTTSAAEASASTEKKQGPTAAAKDDGKTKQSGGGYDSGDSYDSADFQRTADDDAFIDTTGEDQDAVNELYAEQNFDDERPLDEDGGGRKKKKGQKRRHPHPDGRGPPGGEPENPVMAAVHRMKKKKRPKKTGEEIEEEVKLFLNQMEDAAERDERAVAERRPATAKLQMLNTVCDMLTRRDLQRILLDFDLLTVVKRWVQPLPNGTLGNVTVRQRLLESVAKMNGEHNGVAPNHLKRSGLGKTVMILYKHRSETPAMKRQLKDLVEQWSRPIFQKSGNMRDLERVQRGTGGLAALAARQQQQERQAAIPQQQQQQEQEDLHSLIASGKKGGAESGVRRVHVPFSKGFAYSVRPVGRAPETSPEQRGAATGDTRHKLSKRMVEKGRSTSKNQRSANMSIEGRASKG